MWYQQFVELPNVSRRKEAHATIQKIQELRRRGVCLHPDARPTACSGKIVESHTVQRAMLQQITRSSKVYALPNHAGAIFCDEGPLRIRLLGVKQASVLPIFCGRHDRELFKPIESRDLAFTEECAALLAFRVLAYELFSKTRSVELAQWNLREFPVWSGMTLAPQRMELGASTALSELQSRKQSFDSMIRATDYAAIRYLGVQFHEMPEFMCSGYTIADSDFDGLRIQELGDLTRRMDCLSVSVLAHRQSAFCMFAWHEEDGPSAIRLLLTLLALGPRNWAKAIAQFVFGRLENFFLSPDWWEGTSATQRAQITAQVKANASVTSKPAPDYLLDFRNHTFDWTPSRVATNDPALVSVARRLNCKL